MEIKILCKEWGEDEAIEDGFRYESATASSGIAEHSRQERVCEREIFLAHKRQSAQTVRSLAYKSAHLAMRVYCSR